MHLVRKSALVPVRWKNDGGITHEVMRVPAGADPFRWRLSIASVEAEGPFSDFGGYDRTLVLLEGGEMRLTFRDDGTQAILREPGAQVEFDGGREVQCELPAGCCTDLNLLVAQSTAQRAWVERLEAPRAVQPPPRSTLITFLISGTLSIDMDDGRAVTLSHWDCAVFAPADRGALQQAAGDSPPLVFFAALDDNVG